MRPRWLVVAIVLAGCGGGSMGRLTTGAEAVAYRPKEPGVPVWDLPTGIQVVDDGTRVMVVADDGAGDDRRVRVSFLDGRFRGQAGTMDRKDLRPVSR